DATWQPGLRQSAGVRGVPAAAVRAAEPGPAGATGRGVGPATAAAGAAPRRLPARGGAGGLRQHHPRRRQHLLGGQPADRRGGPLFADHIEVWYAQRLVERLPRLRGRGKHRIAYRHVIDWLVRKPGAFAGYRYRDELFPSSRFRLAYDRLVEQRPERAVREYLGILSLAARQSEAGVEAVLE